MDDIIPFVSKMNSTAKNWSTKNYLDAWATQGIEEYIYLKSQLQKHPYSLNQLLEIYVGKASHDFKNGKAIVNKGRGNQVIRVYEEAVVLGLKRCSSSICATARLFRQSTINEQDFLNMVSKNKTTFSHKLSKEAYLTLFKNFLGVK